jgi:hypothetical protein
LVSGTGHLLWTALLVPGALLLWPLRSWRARFENQSAVEAHDWSFGLAAASGLCLGGASLAEIVW